MLRQKHREAIGKRQQLEKQREGQRHAHDAECKEMHQVRAGVSGVGWQAAVTCLRMVPATSLL